MFYVVNPRAGKSILTRRIHYITVSPIVQTHMNGDLAGRAGDHLAARGIQDLELHLPDAAAQEELADLFAFGRAAVVESPAIDGVGRSTRGMGAEAIPVQGILGKANVGIESPLMGERIPIERGARVFRTMFQRRGHRIRQRLPDHVVPARACV